MPDLVRAQRLREARAAAGYARAVDAFTTFGWRQSTYFSHENGHRGISHDAIARYASAFRVHTDWLAYGQGPMQISPRRIRIEGHVSDLASIEQETSHSVELAEIDPIEGVNPNDFAAWRVDGNSYYPAMNDGDICFTPRRHGPPDDYIGKRCLIVLRGGKRVIRTLARGSRIGLFVLVGYAIPPLLDIEIEEAAPIVWIRYT